MTTLDQLQIVDAHHHLWDLGRNYYPWLTDKPKRSEILGEYLGIRRTYMPDDYKRDAAGFNVIQTVHVEAEHDRAEQVKETAWLQEISAQYGFPNAIVGHVWFTAPECEEKLAAHRAFPLFRGIRSKPVTSEQPGANLRGKPGTMDDPKWRAGFALLGKHGLSFDLRVPFWHLEEAAELARDFPDTPIALNHTGYPWDRSPEGLAAWRKSMETLARSSNVQVKVSELGLPDRPWTVEGNRSVVLDAIAIFGIDRCMFGSNFPVSGLFAPYATVLRGVFEILKERPHAELDAFFCSNARRFYRID